MQQHTRVYAPHAALKTYRMPCSVVEYYMLSYFHYNYILYYIPTIMLTSNSFIYNNVNYEFMCIDACIPLEDWRCDQYHWSNQGVRWLPRKDPRVKKSYFHVDTPNGPSREFVKHAYQLLPHNSANYLPSTYILYRLDSLTFIVYNYNNSPHFTIHIRISSIFLPASFLLHITDLRIIFSWFCPPVHSCFTCLCYIVLHWTTSSPSANMWHGAV